MSMELPMGPADRLVRRLVFWQRCAVVGPLVRQFLKLAGTDLPPECLAPGTGLKLIHGGKVVVHANCRIGSNVTLAQFTTLGRADLLHEAEFGGIHVEDGAVIAAGAVVVGKADPVVIGERAVVGANSVLTHSIGPGEIWAGVPARRVGSRP